MVEYHDIVLTAGKQKKRGSLSWSSASASPPPSSMEFRSRTSTNPVTIRLADIKTLSWSRHFDGFTLRVGLAGGTVIKFSGFSEDAYRELLLLAQLRSVDISKETVSTKGTNAGQLGMTGQPHTCTPASCSSTSDKPRCSNPRWPHRRSESCPTTPLPFPPSPVAAHSRAVSHAHVLCCVGQTLR